MFQKWIGYKLLRATNFTVRCFSVVHDFCSSSINLTALSAIILDRGIASTNCSLFQWVLKHFNALLHYKTKMIIVCHHNFSIYFNTYINFSNCFQQISLCRFCVLLVRKSGFLPSVSNKLSRYSQRISPVGKQKVRHQQVNGSGIPTSIVQRKQLSPFDDRKNAMFL